MQTSQGVSLPTRRRFGRRAKYEGVRALEGDAYHSCGHSCPRGCTGACVCCEDVENASSGPCGRPAAMWSRVAEAISLTVPERSA